MKRLQLVLPNTWPTLHTMLASQQPLPPVLARCLQSARVERLTQAQGGNSLEPWQHALLQALPEAARSVGYAPAALCWCGEGGVLRPGTWMRIAPVHFVAGLNAVHVMSPGDISDEQTGQLMSALQPLLSLSGFELYCSAAGHWYTWCEQALDIHTPSVRGALTIHDFELLPAGKDAPQLRRLLTEIQMLLHSHAINQQREQQGLPPVNAIWFSGAGTPVPAASSTAQRIMSDHSYVLGLCHELSVTCWPLPRAVDELLRVRDDDLLLVLSETELPVVASQWLRPVMRALHRGRVGELDVYLDQVKLSFRGGRWQQLRRKFSSKSSLGELLA